MEIVMGILIRTFTYLISAISSIMILKAVFKKINLRNIIWKFINKYINRKLNLFIWFLMLAVLDLGVKPLFEFTPIFANYTRILDGMIMGVTMSFYPGKWSFNKNGIEEN